MRKLSRVSRLLTNDETVIIRREDLELGDNTILVDGRHVKRGYTEFSALCSVQPVQGDDVMLEPAGNRYNDQLFFYIWDETERVAQNDLIWRPPTDGEVEGTWYVVQACESWGSYVRARGQQTDIGPYSGNTDLLIDSPSLAPDA